jgi:hypothetical protein
MAQIMVEMEIRKILRSVGCKSCSSPAWAIG